MSGRSARRLRGSSPLERDDAVIEALARRDTDGDESDDAVRLLAAWCQRIDDVPAPSAAPLTAVVERLPPRPARSFARWVAAATLAVSGLLLGGVHAVEQARPGSTFWPLTELFDRDRARSLVAFQQADDYLTHASTALEQGQIHSAAAAVVQARAVIDQVRPEDGRPVLTVRLVTLEGRIGSLTGDPAPAGGHLPRVPHPIPSGGAQTHVSSPRRGGASTVPADPTDPASPTPTGPAPARGGSGDDTGNGTDEGDQSGVDHTDPSGSTSTDPPSPTPTPTPTELAGPADDNDDAATSEPRTKNTRSDTARDTNGDSNGNADGNAGGTVNGQDGTQRTPGRNTPQSDSEPAASSG